MGRAAARRGIVLPSRARQITTDDLSRFDHVLTMDRQNLEAVRGLAGRGEASARIGPLTRYCRRYSVEEVPDPYYGGEEGFDRVLDLLEDACGGLLEALKADRETS